MAIARPLTGSVAARDRRSLNQQALMLIDGGLALSEPAAERANRQTAAWRSLAGQWVSHPNAADEADSIFAARSAGRDVDL